MPLTPEERKIEQLHHAIWRVSFCKWLLQAHRNIKIHRDTAWCGKEIAILLALREAESELGQLNGGEIVRFKEEPVPA